MAFGQVSGSPASAKQVRELLDLLQAAGHSDFRDARGPMGFTQRQAGGKFSRDEAQAFIDQLEEEAQSGDAAAVPVASTPKAASKRASTPASKAAARPVPAPAAEPSGRPLTPMERALRAATGDQLADELRRRGWRTVER
jgi:septal ring-binding cell division protein DamX